MFRVQALSSCNFASSAARCFGGMAAARAAVSSETVFRLSEFRAYDLGFRV